MSWLKEPAAPAPPEPGRVNIEWMMQTIQAKAPPLSVADQYLMTQAPKQQLDKWGQPLPLCDADQDRLDRIFAIIASPYDRTRALLKAGMLAPDEVDALQATAPEIYQEIWRQAEHELITTEPPYQGWAETVLGFFFGKPPAEVLNTGEGGAPAPGSPPKGKAGNPGKAAGEIAAGAATQADRRDVSVREQRNS